MRILLQFPPPFSPHLKPIERSWGVIRRPIPRNWIFPDVRRATGAIFTFFYDILFLRNGKQLGMAITQNFRVITHDHYRAIGRYERNG